MIFATYYAYCRCHAAHSARGIVAMCLQGPLAIDDDNHPAAVMSANAAMGPSAEPRPWWRTPDT